MINIGKKILSYRRSNGLTIRDLAEKTGLSTAIISQLERNIANPSLSVLKIIACTIGMTVSELVAEECDTESLILRKKNRQQTYNPDDRYIIYNLLTPGSMNADICMTLVHCEPHSETFQGQFHAHVGEEIVFVLTGHVTVVFESTEFTVDEGDTFRVPPHYKHRYINNSDVIAELLTVKTQYK